MLRGCSPTIYTLEHPCDLPGLFCYVVYTSYTLETASMLSDRMDCDIHMSRRNSDVVGTDAENSSSTSQRTRWRLWRWSMCVHAYVCGRSHATP